MFDLTAFDAELTRAYRRDHPGDDILLARSLRHASQESGITQLGGIRGTLATALLLSALTAPDLLANRGTGSAVVAHPSLFETMTVGWLPGDARTWPHDPNRDRS